MGIRIDCAIWEAESESLELIDLTIGISPGDSGLCNAHDRLSIAAHPCGETNHCCRIFSIVFPFASSSISLSK